MSYFFTRKSEIPAEKQRFREGVAGEKCEVCDLIEWVFACLSLELLVSKPPDGVSGFLS